MSFVFTPVLAAKAAGVLLSLFGSVLVIEKGTPYVRSELSKLSLPPVVALPVTPAHASDENMRLVRGIDSLMRFHKVTEVNVNDERFHVVMHELSLERFKTCGQIVNDTAKKMADEILSTFRKEMDDALASALLTFKTGVIDPHFANQSETAKKFFDFAVMAHEQTWNVNLNKWIETWQKVVFYNLYVGTLVAAAVFTAYRQSKAKKPDCMIRAAYACGLIGVVWLVMGWLMYDWSLLSRGPFMSSLGLCAMAGFDLFPFSAGLDRTIQVETLKDEVRGYKEDQEIHQLQDEVLALKKKRQMAETMTPGETGASLGGGASAPFLGFSIRPSDPPAYDALADARRTLSSFIGQSTQERLQSRLGDRATA